MSAAVVVLAAGRASRFGSTKQLAERRGEPLVAHVVATALAADVTDVVVVLGHDAGRVRAVLPDDPRVWIVDNPRYVEGQATSLAAGLAALRPEVNAAVILLADEPDVAAASIDAVVAAWLDGATVARARYADGPGHPVCFDRSIWPRLAELTGDRGARDLLGELDVELVPVHGDRPVDVDRPSDLAATLDG